MAGIGRDGTGAEVIAADLDVLRTGPVLHMPDLGGRATTRQDVKRWGFAMTEAADRLQHDLARRGQVVLLSATAARGTAGWKIRWSISR